MNIKRCYRVVFFDPPKRSEENDYFLFKHYSGFWMIWKNTLSTEKFQCDSFDAAYRFALDNAGLRGRTLWLSLDNGVTWEKHLPSSSNEKHQFTACG